MAAEQSAQIADNACCRAVAAPALRRKPEFLVERCHGKKIADINTKSLGRLLKRRDQAILAVEHRLQRQWQLVALDHRPQCHVALLRFKENAIAEPVHENAVCLHHVPLLGRRRESFNKLQTN